MNIKKLQKAVELNKIECSKHTLQRMIERGIKRVEVKETILNGEVIEEYLDDRPYPSCLILSLKDEALHIVVALDIDNNICYIITAYRPDLKYFKNDYKTRRIQ